MDFNVTVDEKGRILIPKEIRENFKIKPGDRFSIRIERNSLILLKTESLNDFQSELETFQEKLKKFIAEPMPTEKLF